MQRLSAWAVNGCTINTDPGIFNNYILLPRLARTGPSLESGKQMPFRLAFVTGSVDGSSSRVEKKRVSKISGFVTLYPVA